jgi:uncharacterized membrane protein YesL
LNEGMYLFQHLYVHYYIDFVNFIGVTMLLVFCSLLYDFILTIVCKVMVWYLVYDFVVLQARYS